MSYYEHLISGASMSSTYLPRTNSNCFLSSVQYIQIECLWVDVTTQVGATGKELFYMLELHYGLDINNVNHIWLLQYLFLPLINLQLQFFAESWNNHKLQIRGGPNRSPIDMFGFDMVVYGLRGRELEIELNDEELELYGLDWDALDDDAIRSSQLQNNPVNEGTSSWIGRRGPPDNLSEVTVESPEAPLDVAEVNGLHAAIQHLPAHSDDTSVVQVWTTALAYVRTLHHNEF